MKHSFPMGSCHSAATLVAVPLREQPCPMGFLDSAAPQMAVALYEPSCTNGFPSFVGAVKCSPITSLAQPRTTWDEIRMYVDYLETNWYPPDKITVVVGAMCCPRYYSLTITSTNNDLIVINDYPSIQHDTKHVIAAQHKFG